MSSHVFADRKAAGMALAGKLRAKTLPPPLIVLGLPRGSVPVAFEVARALSAPLDVMSVRKIGMPGQRALVGAEADSFVILQAPTRFSWKA